MRHLIVDLSCILMFAVFCTACGVGVLFALWVTGSFLGSLAGFIWVALTTGVTP